MRLLAHEVAHTLQGTSTLRRSPPVTNPSSEPTTGSVTTGWRGDLFATLVDLVIAFGDVSLDRAVLLAHEIETQIQACFDDGNGDCLVFGDEEVSSIAEFNERMRGQTAVRIYGPTLQTVLTTLGVGLADVEARTVAPAHVDFSARPEAIESIQDPWGYFERAILSKPERDRPVHVERWITMLGYLGLTAVRSSEDGERALIQAYAILWERGYDERFVPTGDAIVSVVAPARGMGEVAEQLPAQMFRGASLVGEDIVIRLEYSAFDSEILSTVGTSAAGRREFYQTDTITVPADSVVVVVEEGERQRVSALQLLELTAARPDNPWEALESLLTSGERELTTLVNDTVDATGTLVVETIGTAKTAAIEGLLELATNIEDDEHRRLAFELIYALDSLASVVTMGVSAAIGVVGGLVKGVVGIASGFASLAGSAVGVIEDLATWVIEGDFGDLHTRVEQILVALTEIIPAVVAALEAWTTEFEAADPNEKARLIGDAVGRVLMVVAEFLVGTKTGTIRELRETAVKRLDQLRRAATELSERTAAWSVSTGKKALAAFDDFGTRLLMDQTEAEKWIWKKLGIEPGGGTGGPPPAVATGAHSASPDGVWRGSVRDERPHGNELLSEASDGPEHPTPHAVDPEVPRPASTSHGGTPPTWHGEFWPDDLDDLPVSDKKVVVKQTSIRASKPEYVPKEGKVIWSLYDEESGARFGQAFVEADSFESAAQGSPDLWLHSQKAQMPDGTRVALDKADRFSWTDESLAHVVRVFRETYGRHPENLGGDLAADNLRAFQVKYAELANMDSNIDPTEIAALAILATPFGKSRVKLGYDSFKIEMGDFISTEQGLVPTTVRVEAHTSSSLDPLPKETK